MSSCSLVLFSLFSLFSCSLKKNTIPILCCCSLLKCFYFFKHAINQTCWSRAHNIFPAMLMLVTGNHWLCQHVQHFLYHCFEIGIVELSLPPVCVFFKHNCLERPTSPSERLILTPLNVQWIAKSLYRSLIITGRAWKSNFPSLYTDRE